MREAVLAHHGETEDTLAAFQQLTKHDQDTLIEFLKPMQIAPRSDMSRRRDN
jgi:hypothetical protein